MHYILVKVCTNKSLSLPLRRYVAGSFLPVPGCLLSCQQSAVTKRLSNTPSRTRRVSRPFIVPRQVLNGLLLASHVQLSHPSSHHLKLATHCHLFALDLDKSVDRTTQSCHCCTALRQTPRICADQTSVFRWQ